MPTQHSAKLLAQHVVCVWPPCCDVLAVVGSSLTIFKLEPTTPNKSQHIATWWPNAHKQDMLRWHVAIVWLGLNLQTVKCHLANFNAGNHMKLTCCKKRHIENVKLFQSPKSLWKKIWMYCCVKGLKAIATQVN